MQKIVIRNFGAIKEADIEVKKILVLIGEQASGKSTVAKLIYFFKALSDRVFDRYYTSESSIFSFAEHIASPIRDEFYKLFGSAYRFQDFEITYYYDIDKKYYIKLHLGINRELIVDGSNNFKNGAFHLLLNASKNQITLIEEQIKNVPDNRKKLALTEDKLGYIQALSFNINNAFSNDQNVYNYIIAGRESTVSYQSTFESYLEKTLMDALEDNRKKSEIDRAQSVDEVLMLDFLREVQRFRKVFNANGGSFINVIAGFLDRKTKAKSSENEKKDNRLYSLVLKNSEEILKGEYEIDQNGEKIKISDLESVYLKDASSGQKESIRILQYVLLSILENQRFFRVVEEPEAHLFPVAQKKLIELLVLMANYMPESQLVITTHSPYVLTVINNLLFAARVIGKNPKVAKDVDKIIDQAFSIDPKLFSAYSLASAKKNSGENIFNENSGVIKQNYLDIVSEMLSADFNRLYNIHAKSFSPKQV